MNLIPRVNLVNHVHTDERERVPGLPGLLAEVVRVELVGVGVVAIVPMDPAHRDQQLVVLS